MSESLPAVPQPTSHRQVAALLISNIVYLLITFGGSLNLYPLGQDYRILGLADGLPLPSQWLVDAWQHVVISNVWRLDTLTLSLGEALGQVLQVELWLWHSLNLFLLWTCMTGLFFLTRLTLGGMWWLGSFAAVLLMANPLKSEAAMLVTAHGYLIPAACALWGMVGYVSDGQRPAFWKKAIYLILFAVTFCGYPEYRGLVFLPFLFEIVVADRTQRRLSRAVGVFAMFLIGLWFHGTGVPGGVSLEDRIAPLFLIVYPIGILPSTLLDLQAAVWLFWIYAAVDALLLLGLIFLVRDRVVTFGILGAICFRFAQGETEVDLVHLAGGGNMIVPIALVALALAAICHRVMQHPKWPRYVVAITTVLCVVLIGLQIRSVLAWRHASDEVQAYRAIVRDFVNGEFEQQYIVAPSFRYYRDAPIDLYASVGGGMYENSDTSQWPLRYTPDTRVLIQKASDGSFTKMSVPGKSLRDVLYVPGQIRPDPRAMLYTKNLFSQMLIDPDDGLEYIYYPGGLKDDDRRIPYRVDVEVVETETQGVR